MVRASVLIVNGLVTSLVTITLFRIFENESFKKWVLCEGKWRRYNVNLMKRVKEIQKVFPMKRQKL